MRRNIIEQLVKFYEKDLSEHINILKEIVPEYSFDSDDDKVVMDAFIDCRASKDATEQLNMRIKKLM